jgi:hypothetical protein
MKRNYTLIKDAKSRVKHARGLQEWKIVDDLSLEDDLAMKWMNYISMRRHKSICLNG